MVKNCNNSVAVVCSELQNSPRQQFLLIKKLTRCNDSLDANVVGKNQRTNIVVILIFVDLLEIG